MLLLAALAACLPAQAIEPEQLVVVVNLEDAQSRALGAYYREARGLPRENVVEVRFKPGQAQMSEAEFQRVRAEVDAQAPATTQAYALAWTLPFRVECMSVTSAFAFGFDRALCAEGCKATRPSPLYRAATREPYTDLGLRPAMLLAARDLPQGRALVDRGVAADRDPPSGSAYLMSTSDKHRNVRAANYPVVEALIGERLKVHRLNQDALYGARDVMFYFTGLKDVKGLGTLGFRPGAVADHLTSNGGVLKDSPQMSALAWLTAGATASYGTVVEPCNFTQKFPDPVVLVDKYLAGETVLEAYWKSVAMPGQGVFIGEPLAKPFAARP
ncbi:MAG: TIGR03790 family protein [Gammaproteobacteria bacterium]